MNQLNEKDIIRHYLLNLLTILNIELSNFNIKRADKRKIDDLIGVASILIANENIFLNEKSSLFIQDVHLKDLIELNCEILKSEIQKKKISINLPQDDLIIKVDKFYFSEALKYLLKELIKDNTKISFGINKTDNKLEIIHERKTELPQPADKIIDLLKTKNFQKDDITFQLACTIIKIHNIKLSLKNNCIIMSF